MIKVLYKIIILVGIFIGSFIFFSKNIKEEKIDFDTTVEMGDTTFPILYLKSKNQEMNLLHGYSGNINANLVRDCVTPLDKDKSFSVLIDEKESVVKKIKYEVRKVLANELIDSGSISSLDSDEAGRKTAKIRIKANLEIGKEYTVSIIVITDTSKKIYYYTRTKILEDEHIAENIEFAMNFHRSIMDKTKAEDIIIYLEPNYSADSTSLARVNINSNFDLISWGKLKPTVIGQVVPTIKEVNQDNSSIELKYMVSAETKSGTEYYMVKEYYRIRWTNTRMYLLNYDRSMESVFDMKLVNTEKSEFKIGITGEDGIDLIASNDNNKLCFVREKSLWYYNILENNAVNVFTFAQEETDYIRDRYDQHNIRILNMDEDGNIDFIVYGYMNRGDYEGRVAIVLYKFFSSENRIEEQVYIPIDIPYQILKEELNSFSYVSQSRVFYFSINNTIYSYNIITKGLKEIVSNISSDSLSMPKGGKYVAWQNDSNAKKSKSITILDLENGNEKIIYAPTGNNIIILGNIDLNIIYGYCETRDITKKKDGSYQTPLYKIEIANSLANVEKDYEKKGYYVVNSRVEDNVIELERVKKEIEGGKQSFIEAESDYILNKIVDTRQPISILSRTTEEAFTEQYISLPSGFVMKEEPSTATVSNTIISQDTTLYLSKANHNEVDIYFVYARGEIVASYEKASDAIIHADNCFGVVVNKEQQIIWARGVKLVRSEIKLNNSDKVSSNINSISACINMMLSYNKLSEGLKKDFNVEDSIYDVLTESLGNKAINLSGCTLEEILYFISEKKPVIAMKDKKNAVLIIAYDEFNISIMDPSIQKVIKMGLNDSAKLFKEAGNIFISYIN